MNRYLSEEDLLVECCDSKNVVCSLMADSKSKVISVGEVIYLVRFGDLQQLLGDQKSGISYFERR